MDPRRHQSQMRSSLPVRTAPYQVLVQSVDTVAEEMIFSDSSKSSKVRYPYVSETAWIRSMPSAGVRAVVAYSPISKKLEMVGYEFNKSAEMARKYTARQSLYRQLQEGEHEIMSSGRASSFYGRYPVKVDRAGVVSARLDGLKLEHVVRAPTTVWRGSRNRPDVIGHEMRVGAVKRSLSANKEVYALKLGSLPDLGTCIFANEYLLALNSDVTDTPLIDIRSGEVYDDVLTPGYPMAMPLLGSNNLPLRHRAKYFVTVEPGTVGVPKQSTDLEIDTLGNVSLNLSKLSIIGLAVKVPLGRVLLSCGLDMTLDAKLGIVLKSLGQIKIEGKAGVSIDTPAIVNVSGTAGVHIKATTASIETTGPASIEAKGSVEVSSLGPAVVSGKAGVTLKGAAGGAGARPINTLPIDPVTGIITYTDPTVRA